MTGKEVLISKDKAEKIASQVNSTINYLIREAVNQDVKSYISTVHTTKLFNYIFKNHNISSYTIIDDSLIYNLALYIKNDGVFLSVGTHAIKILITKKEDILAKDKTITFLTKIFSPYNLQEHKKEETTYLIAQTDLDGNQLAISATSLLDSSIQHNASVTDFFLDIIKSCSPRNNINLTDYNISVPENLLISKTSHDFNLLASKLIPNQQTFGYWINYALSACFSIACIYAAYRVFSDNQQLIKQTTSLELSINNNNQQLVTQAQNFYESITNLESIAKEVIKPSFKGAVKKITNAQNIFTPTKKTSKLPSSKILETLEHSPEKTSKKHSLKGAVKKITNAQNIFTPTKKTSKLPSYEVAKPLEQESTIKHIQELEKTIENMLKKLNNQAPIVITTSANTASENEDKLTERKARFRQEDKELLKSNEESIPRIISALTNNIPKKLRKANLELHPNYDDIFIKKINKIMPYIYSTESSQTLREDSLYKYFTALTNLLISDLQKKETDIIEAIKKKNIKKLETIMHLSEFSAKQFINSYNKNQNADYLNTSFFFLRFRDFLSNRYQDNIKEYIKKTGNTNEAVKLFGIVFVVSIGIEAVDAGEVNFSNQENLEEIEYNASDFTENYFYEEDFYEPIHQEQPSTNYIESIENIFTDIIKWQSCYNIISYFNLDPLSSTVAYPVCYFAHNHIEALRLPDSNDVNNLVIDLVQNIATHNSITIIKDAIYNLHIDFY
jgi:hypothetical protein